MSEHAEAAAPDYIYDPADWEWTIEWSSRGDLVDDMQLDVRDVKRFSTLNKGPDKWAAHVVKTVDDAGDPDETAIEWFDSEEEARAALSTDRPATDEDSKE